MAGGLLQLVAYGAQDVYISGNPHITFWKILQKRHTNFAMEAFRVNFTGAPAFGQRVVAIVNRNADLIGKTYLEVVLPDKDASGNSIHPEAFWNDEQNRFGYLLLKQIEIEIGGQIIDRHQGEWLYIWESLTASPNDCIKLDWMVSSTITTSVASNCVGRPRVLQVPLQFWFNRNPGLALPLIALQQHEVRINIIFNDAVNCINPQAGAQYNGQAPSVSKVPNLLDACLYIDQVYLDTEERRRFAQQSHEYLIEQLQYNEDQSITHSSSRVDLTLNHPVKELIWVFQNSTRLDCSNGHTVSPFTYDDIVHKARLQLNGQDRFDERQGDYFWKVQPQQHHTGGWLNLGGARVANNLPLAGPAPSYQVDQPRTASITTPAGQNVVEFGPLNTASISAPKGIESVPGTNFGLGGGCQNPINVQSFAIKPEDHQPSGSCNFSRIDNATFVFDSITAGAAGTFPNKTNPFFFRLYAVNYNILRIMSGMGGLAYSN